MGEAEEKRRKPLQGELVSSMLLWVPGVQALVGSPGNGMPCTPQSSTSQMRGRYLSLTPVRHGWGLRVGGTSACLVQRQGRLGPPEKALGLG